MLAAIFELLVRGVTNPPPPHFSDSQSKQLKISSGNKVDFYFDCMYFDGSAELCVGLTCKMNFVRPDIFKQSFMLVHVVINKR